MARDLGQHTVYTKWSETTGPNWWLKYTFINRKNKYINLGVTIWSSPRGALCYKLLKPLMVPLINRCHNKILHPAEHGESESACEGFNVMILYFHKSTTLSKIPHLVHVIQTHWSCKFSCFRFPHVKCECNSYYIRGITQSWLDQSSYGYKKN